MRPKWFPDWSCERCAIIASGPSATSAPVHLLRGRAKVAVTNNSWRLAPGADVLYASDQAWWRTGAGDGFDGLKVSRSKHAGVHKVELKKAWPDKWVNSLVFDEDGVIGAGAGSGFQLLNLAIQFGTRDIALIGYDHRIDLGTHWHGDHQDGLTNPRDTTAELWRGFLDAAAPALADAGVSVVNCSEVSALTAYRKVSLEEWVANHAEA